MVLLQDHKLQVFAFFRNLYSDSICEVIDLCDRFESEFIIGYEYFHDLYTFIELGMHVNFCHKSELLQLKKNLNGSNCIISGLPIDDAPRKLMKDILAFLSIVGRRGHFKKQIRHY